MTQTEFSAAIALYKSWFNECAKISAEDDAEERQIQSEHLDLMPSKVNFMMTLGEC